MSSAVSIASTNIIDITDFNNIQEIVNINNEPSQIKQNNYIYYVYTAIVQLEHGGDLFTFKLKTRRAEWDGKFTLKSVTNHGKPYTAVDTSNYFIQFLEEIEHDDD